MKKILLLLALITFGNSWAQQTEPTNPISPTRFGTSTVYRFCQSTPPASPTQGQTYLDCDDYKVYQYYNTTWTWILDGGGGGAESTTVSDTAEIDLTLSVADISGVLVTGSIDETKLDASVNASLDLADSASQGAHTTDTNTQLSDAQVATAATNEGFVTGAHTIDTNLDQAGVEALGFVTGAHTVVTNANTITPVIGATTVTEANVESGVMFHQESGQGPHTVTVDPMALDYTSNSGWFTFFKNTSGNTMSIANGSGVSGASHTVADSEYLTLFSVSDDVWQIYSKTNASGTPEGTAILSTGETAGKVLQADGDNTSSWVTLGGGGDALVANPLSQFAATTKAQLNGVISDGTPLYVGDAPTSHNHVEVDITDLVHTTDTNTQLSDAQVATAAINEGFVVGAHTTDTNLTDEEVQDKTGAMVTGNTETLITVTYQDADGTIDYVVDNDLANYSNTTSDFSVGAHTVDTNLDINTLAKLNAIVADATLFTGAHTVDTNTQLTEGQVDTFVSNNGYLTTETDDQVASEVPNTPSGNLIATDVQGALNELQTEVDGLAAGGDGLGPDGDKGDITVGGTGTTLQIDASAITETELNASINASLDLADSSSQGAHTTNTDAQDLTLTGNTLAISGDPNTDVDISTATAVSANTSKITNATHTGDVTGDTALTIAVDAVDIAMLSATGIADGTTFLRGDNVWGGTTFSGGIDTPANYVGSAGYLLRVNATPSGVEFVDGTTLFASTSHAHIEADISDLTHTTDTNLDIASSAEVNTGTDNTKAISPLALAGSQLQTDVTANNAKVTNAFTAGDESKLDAIEASATADQTDAEIKTAVEAATDSNTFTDADHTKLNGIEALADVTDTASVTASGALMDSEVDADIKTMTIAASSTISGSNTGDQNLADTVAEITDLTATASEINTPLDGALVTLTEFQELETIGATVISAADWIAVSNLVGTNTGDEAAASTTVSGVIEVATGAETNTGTDATKAVSPDGLDDWTGSAQLVDSGITYREAVAISDNTTALTTGTKMTWYSPPYAITITDAEASLLTAATGAEFIVDVHDDGVTIMGTNKLDIEVSEFHTKDAVTQPAISAGSIAASSKLEAIIDQVGSTVAGAGAIIYIYYTID